MDGIENQDVNYEQDFDNDEVVNVDEIEEENDDTVEDGEVESTGEEENVDEPADDSTSDNVPNNSQMTPEQMFQMFQQMYQTQQGQQVQPQEQQPEMTVEMAQQIFNQELENGVPPAIAIQNYVDNASSAKLQGFQNQYGQVLNQQMLQQEIAKVSSKYSDYKDYEPELRGIVESQIDKEYTGNDRLSDAAAFEMAYLRQKVAKLEALSKGAFENGKKQASVEAKTQKNIKTPKAGAKNSSPSSDELKGIKIVEQGDGIFL